MRLDKKVAMITGGARGMGKQMALTFAGHGADIVIGDILEMGEVAQEVKVLGRKVITVNEENWDAVFNINLKGVGGVVLFFELSYLK
jgi:NAD(P)-dependent dehydrogenase (short-subunit alcohol dehydrogenase family)